MIPNNSTQKYLHWDKKWDDFGQVADADPNPEAGKPQWAICRRLSFF